MYTAQYFEDRREEKLRDLVGQLSNDDAKNTMKVLNYLDGKQEQELIKFLNKYRKNWKKDQMVPRTRNIVESIVEKSGPVIKDTPPMFNVYSQSESDQPDPILTEEFVELMNKANQQDSWVGFDKVLRALKTVLVLVQYNNDEQTFVFDILHRGNTVVKHDPVTKKIHLALYKVECDGEVEQYRVIVSDLIIDFEYNNQTEEILVLSTEENSWGMVPIVPFYDTVGPRTGFWVNTPMDLTNFNEMYNLHITESEHAISWMKRPTLFTNAQLAETMDEGLSTYENNETVNEIVRYGDKVPRTTFTSGGVQFGPSTAVQLDTTGIDQPFAEFKAPVVDLSPINELFTQWEKSFANDWSVSIDYAGEGRANSGFQLIVEEIPNMELRKMRQRQLAAGFNRLFEIIKTVSTMVNVANFPEQSKLYTEFAEVDLPVDKKESEELWTMKISSNRASLVDYFMEEKEMSQEEAIEKIREIFVMQAMVQTLKQSFSNSEEESQQSENTEEDDSEQSEDDSDE